MKRIIFVACLFLVSHNIGKSCAQKEEEVWWKTANFYQIYPRSYKDADNDGSGDLQGISDKLPYLKSIGVQNIWMSPIFDSPMVDAGYDISDYRQINSLFGSMKDFEDLLAEAHRLGGDICSFAVLAESASNDISNFFLVKQNTQTRLNFKRMDASMRVILDFVPNHTSDQHVWFYRSMLRVPGYEDYYVWEDGTEETLSNGTVVRVPPNNWLSQFLFSAWTWNDIRGQFYYHEFGVAQPDLNYRSEGLVNDMKNTMRYWLDKGIDGFRVDAIPYLFENETLEDEPESGNGIAGVDYQSLIHIYTLDQPETFDMIYQFRAVCEEYDNPPRVMMTEAYTSLENTVKYYGNETTEGASFTFNFFLLTDLKNTSTAKDFENVINKWLDALDPKYTSNWVVGNHDNHRTATRQGVGRVDGINMLVNILPGVGVTYNGEEIGLEDGYVSWEDTQDPGGLNAGPERYQEVSRDPERTPFHWDSSINAGFNEGSKPWLPVSEKYLTNNVALQNEADKSHLKVYRDMLALREQDVLKKGDLTVTAPNDDLLIVARQLEDGAYVLVFNLNENEQTVDLTEVLADNTLTDPMMVTISGINSSSNQGDLVSPTEVTLSPHDAMILGNLYNKYKRF